MQVCNASICAHGDNTLAVSVSYDGTRFEQLSYEVRWWNTTELTLTDIVAPTVLHFEVDDLQEYLHTGGFLATIRLQCSDDENDTFITSESSTHFDVVYSANNDYFMDNFEAFGSGPRSNLVNEENVKCMDPNAYWIWNRRNAEDLVFALDLFANTATSEYPTFGMCLLNVYSL